MVPVVAVGRFFKWTAFKCNVLIFIAVSLIISLIAERLPARFYDYKKRLYRERKWEEGGRIYERFFFVKKWKSKLPELSDYIKTIFSKKHLQSLKGDYLSVFLEESCKAEFTHWVIILSSLLFYFSTDLFTASRILFLAAALNMPYIIIQRYNRPRIIRLLKKSEEEGCSLQYHQPTLT